MSRRSCPLWLRSFWTERLDEEMEKGTAEGPREADLGSTEMETRERT